MIQNQAEGCRGVPGFADYGKVGGVFHEPAHAVARHFAMVGDDGANAFGRLRMKRICLGGHHAL